MARVNNWGLRFNQTVSATVEAGKTYTARIWVGSPSLDHARAGVKRGQSKEEVQKLDVLKGFEDNASPNARLTLAFVLGLAYDEVTNAKP